MVLASINRQQFSQRASQTKNDKSKKLYANTSSHLTNHQYVPEWLIEPYIYTSYRPENKSWRSCWQSIFHLHNQTFDIWSHLFALIVYIFLSAHFFLHQWQHSTRECQIANQHDRILFAVYFIGVYSCFLGSSVFHIFGCHSERVHEVLLALDQSGIIAVFWASSFFLNWYGYHLHNVLFWLSVARASIISAGVLYLLWSSIHVLPSIGILKSSSAAYIHNVRMVALLVLFLSELANMAFMSHLLVNTHFLWSFLRTYMSYMLGMLFYISKFPESLFPGQFDIFLKSHTIWHICILIGALNFYPLVVDMFEHHLLRSCTFDV